MRDKLRTYGAYSVGCAVTWAVILIVLTATGSGKRDTVLLVAAGWVIGWASATIARFVYPPPKKWRGGSAPE